MTSYRRGDVVLVPFPFTDLSGAKQRPAVVISSDRHNAESEDVILAAITSKLPTRLSDEEYLLSGGTGFRGTSEAFHNQGQ